MYEINEKVLTLVRKVGIPKDSEVVIINRHASVNQCGNKCEYLYHVQKLDKSEEIYKEHELIKK